MSENVEIALSADARFYPGMFMAACSVAYYASRDVRLTFHLLDGGVGAEHRADLERIVRQCHPSVTFDWLSIDEKTFDGLPEWRGRGKMTWARLWLPKLLPNSEWIVYLDTDFLCLADIAELWRLRRSDMALMSCVDGWKTAFTTEGAWFAARGLAFDENRYFCAGLCFFNLNRFRKQGLDEACVRFATEHPDVCAVDQSVLNAIFSNRSDLQLVSSRWQTFTRSVTKEELLARPFLHYAGEAPWACLHHTFIATDLWLLWFRLYAMVRHVSLWRAMREFYSAGMIVRCRVLYLILSRVPLMKNVLFAYFKLIGHGDSIEIYKGFLHRFEMPKFSYFVRRS